MSGPKLSEYELEQLRKAELERIQREIANSHASILRMQRDVSSEQEWCKQELEQIERQLNLLGNCSLPQGELSQAKRVILSEKQRIHDLLHSWSNIKANVIEHPDELAEVQAEEHRIRGLLSGVMDHKAMILNDRIEYETVMASIAENLKGSLSCSILSLAEALQNIHSAKPDGISESADVEKLRTEMLGEIVRLKRSRFASAKDVDRLDKAVQLISHEGEHARLKEVNSLVVKELSYKFTKMEAMYDEYTDVLCLHNALLSHMGEATLAEETFDSVAKMADRIAAIRAENASMHRRILAFAERAEITKSIDEAMSSLGYDLIGTKEVSVKGCVKLYQFAGGTGIQMVQKADGSVRLKVVGLSKSNRLPEGAEKEHLLHMQEEFCSAYEQIKGAFMRHGINQVHGSERKLPPDDQFSQIVNVAEYNSTYVAMKDTPASQGKKKRVSVYEPKYMTQGS